jgi:hypothetical protein
LSSRRGEETLIFVAEERRGEEKICCERLCGEVFLVDWITGGEHFFSTSSRSMSPLTYIYIFL